MCGALLSSHVFALRTFVFAHISFVSPAQTQYVGTTYAGYVGLLTGMRPYALTLSVDERDQGAWWQNALEALLDKKAVPVSFLIRCVRRRAVVRAVLMRCAVALRDTLATDGITFGAVRGFWWLRRSLFHSLSCWLAWSFFLFSRAIPGR